MSRTRWRVAGLPFRFLSTSGVPGVEFGRLRNLIDVQVRLLADELTFEIVGRRFLPAAPHRLVAVHARARDLALGRLLRRPRAIGPAVVAPERKSAHRRTRNVVSKSVVHGESILSCAGGCGRGRTVASE